ncbi:hypothetical protein L6164_033180 [Bauhinia variegata]|uniref:Uncharacterized protein n=1 Tax=Bauhinia variegata TaxID=167791 RepID=A0ACB9KR71_BAUVA|nr:hypothetical protein L6164_033180 [Bauhinia variegata]
MKGGGHLCLYGSENLEWIQKFTRTTRSVAKADHISLDMVYVGNARIGSLQTAKMKMKSMIATIAKEYLSSFWPDYSSIWFFWERLDTMLVSKKKEILENHMIISVIVTLLARASFHRSDDGWATFFGGAHSVLGDGLTHVL